MQKNSSVYLFWMIALMLSSMLKFMHANEVSGQITFCSYVNNTINYNFREQRIFLKVNIMIQTC